jgi:hypothetical protein
LHGKVPCNGTDCAPKGQDPPKLTAEELEAAGIPFEQGMEAQGICPGTGETFQKCFASSCDCFLDNNTIHNYVRACQREVIRQAQSRREQTS